MCRNSDREMRLTKQRDVIKNVISWLRQEGLEPQEITHLRKDASYYGVVVSNEAEKTEPVSYTHLTLPTKRIV